MACYHIKYEGVNFGYDSGTNCYTCDLCGKKWDWKDSHVENVCKNGEEYRKCPIWQKYA